MEQVVVERRYYADISTDKIEDGLRANGYDPLLIHEPPDTRLEAHNHPPKHILVIVDGEMELEIDSNQSTLYPGDMATIPPRTTHAATFGSQGCRYFWIEQ